MATAASPSRLAVGDGEVEVTIRDNGRGMSAEQADTIFDPSFKVADGRVSSGNWSLFNSRQIVYEHGGDIRIETSPGAGYGDAHYAAGCLMCVNTLPDICRAVSFGRVKAS